MDEASLGTEKRQAPRVKTSIPVRYREIDGADGTSVGTLTADMSTGGLRLGTNKFLSVASRLLLHLDIPTLAKPIEAVSQVAWVQKANEGEGFSYHVGNQFMEITGRDQELIMTYLKSC